MMETTDSSVLDLDQFLLIHESRLRWICLIAFSHWLTSVIDVTSLLRNIGIPALSFPHWQGPSNDIFQCSVECKNSLCHLDSFFLHISISVVQFLPYIFLLNWTLVFFLELIRTSINFQFAVWIVSLMNEDHNGKNAFAIIAKLWCKIVEIL